MCFSPTASFIASGVLGATGIATLKKTEAKSEIPFASIPLLFAIQQFIEGTIWLTIGADGLFKTVMTYSFLAFSHIIWPVFTPLSVLMIEEDKNRRKILLGLLAIGIFISGYLSIFIVGGGPVSCETFGNIRYLVNIPHVHFIAFLYSITIVFSCLFSTKKIIKVFGIAVAVSSFSAFMVYRMTYISVWCFFGAVLSMMIYFHFAKATFGALAERFSVVMQSSQDTLREAHVPFIADINDFFRSFLK
jgi:hypothetical protein